MSRPKLYENSADRVRASVHALIARGGSRKSIRLSPKATRALIMLKKRLKLETDTEVIEMLIIEAAIAKKNEAAASSATKKTPARASRTKTAQVSVGPALAAA